MRYLVAGLLIGTVTAAPVACGGDDGGDGAPDLGGVVEIPYEAIASLTNYAFASQLEVSSEETDLQATFEGAFEAPDHIQGAFSLRGEPYEQMLESTGQPAEGEIVVIGEHVWWKDTEGQWHLGRDVSEETANPLIAFRLYAAPEFYLEALQFESLSLPVAGPVEQVNGVDAIPIQLDKKAIVGLLEQGTSIEVDPDYDDRKSVSRSIIRNAEEVLPESFLVEAWFAEEGLYPVRIVFDYEIAEDGPSGLSFGFGLTAHIRLALEITDPEAGVEIEPPLPIPTEVEPPLPPPGATVPSLTPEDRSRIQEIALADPRLQRILAGREYEITEPFFVWHDSRLQKLGGGFFITFDDPFALERDWPIIAHDESEATDPPFRTIEIHFRAEQIEKLRVLVYLPSEELVEIEPQDVIISEYTPLPLSE